MSKVIDHQSNKQEACGDSLPPSFCGLSGRFYVRQRRADGSGFHHRCTVWPSVEDYNQRRPAPLAFMDVADALADFSHAIQICPLTLTTTWPADRDESDQGLTPVRNFWHDKFRQAKEGRVHAA